MIRLDSTVCIDASTRQVWKVLSRLEDVQLWAEAVLVARCDGPTKQGVGAERSCQLKGNISIHETWLSWEEERSFSYAATGLPMMKRAVNTWTLQPEGDKTLLTSEARLELKGGLVGRLLEPLFLRQVRTLVPQSLAALKYLVEHGEPPKVKHAALLPLTQTC